MQKKCEINISLINTLAAPVLADFLHHINLFWAPINNDAVGKKGYFLDKNCSMILQILLGHCLMGRRKLLPVLRSFQYLLVAGEPPSMFPI